MGFVWVVLRRLVLVGRQWLRHSWWSLRWLVRERELRPDAYELTPRNRRHLACFVAAVAEVKTLRVMECIEELEDDKALRDQLRAGPRDVARLACSEALYGSRAAAYVLTRLRRPRTVVECGIGDGLVACMVAAALERNAAEGQPGFYFGLDHHPGAGRLLSGRYERYGWILAGAPLEALKEIDRIELYLHSRRCSPERETREYEVLQSRLAEDAIVLSSSAHASDALYAFALESGRRFLPFAEEPFEHWYRGAQIGAAFL